MAASPLTVTADWGRVVGETTRLSFGLNLFQGFNPEEVSAPEYRRNVGESWRHCS